MTNENVELAVKIGAIFGVMILGIVLIAIGSSLQDLVISSVGGIFLIITFIGAISLFRSI